MMRLTPLATVSLNALGDTVEITSLDILSDTSVRLNIADTLPDGEFTLSVPTGSDLAGNAFDGDRNFEFVVDAITRIVRTGPADGTERTNLDRQIFVEFDRPINPATVTSESFQVIALGEPLAGRIAVSSDGKIITFFPEDQLPAATELRLKVDGDAITGIDGKSIDANGDGQPGGVLEADFQTVTLTRIPNTNIEGFIFDSNNRDEDDMDIPLEGVVVSVVGLPDVSAVTDENGRFFLQNLPIPQVYLDFDASDVVNRPNFDYGTIVKPVDTVAGQTVGMASNGKAFNIYFAALAEGDVTEIVEGEVTEAGIGENNLANLTELFPNIDPSEWGKLKVTIPEDSLSFDDGTLATEVTVAVFEPDRIPAPVPEGLDPTVVFTVKAGDATNVDGKAQIEFPNLDGLAPGAKVPIMSFDHDAGEWVQSGTGIVTEDGERIISEGDTGVNTLGWKFLGIDLSKLFTLQIDEIIEDFFGGFVEEVTDLARNLGNLIPGFDKLPGVKLLNADAARDALETLRDFYNNPDPSLQDITEAISAAGEIIGIIPNPIAMGVGAIMGEVDRARQIGESVNDLVERTGNSLNEGLRRRFEETSLQQRNFWNQTENKISVVQSKVQGTVFSADDFDIQERVSVANDIEDVIVAIDRWNEPNSISQQFISYTSESRNVLSDFAAVAGITAAAAGAYVLISNSSGSQRKIADDSGQVRFTTVDDEAVNVQIAVPGEGLVGEFLLDPNTADSEQTVILSELELGQADTDGDGLSDELERIVGTSEVSDDSDGDGILDGAEIEQGLNPLDGVGFPTGVIGALSLQGEAKDLTIIGNLDGEGQTAFIATGSHGLAIVDASQFSNPILVGQLELPGTADQVTVDTARNVAYVSAGGGRRSCRRYRRPEPTRACHHHLHARRGQIRPFLRWRLHCRWRRARRLRGQW